MSKFISLLLAFASMLYFAMMAISLYLGNFDLAFFILGAAGITGACLAYILTLNQKQL